jgi:hypothetical protein
MASRNHSIEMPSEKSAPMAAYLGATYPQLISCRNDGIAKASLIRRFEVPVRA